MKSILLSTCILISGLCSAQNAPINFEPDGFGANFTWATFEAPEGATNPAFSVVPNDLGDPTNGSATIGKIEIEYATDANWGSAGCETMHGADVGAFSFTNDNAIVTMMVYQEDFAAPVAVKFATPTGAAFAEVIAPNTVADAWVELEFDLSAWIGDPLGGQPDQFIFFPSYAPRSTGHTVYFDNVSFSATPPPVGDPMVDAPNPTIDEDLVLSVYSDFYTNNTVNNFNFNAFQGGGVISEVDLEGMGNNAGKIEQLSFYGAEWMAADVSEFDTLRFNYWSSSSTGFNFYLIDQSAAIPGGAPEEPRYAFGGANPDEAIVQGAWQTVAIPVQHFLDYNSGAFDYDLTDAFQWKFDGSGTIFFDNVYFSKNVLGLAELDLQNFKVFPNPAVDRWTIASQNAVIEKVQVFNALGQLVWSDNPVSTRVAIDANALKPGIYTAVVSTKAGAGTTKLVKE